MYIDLLLNASNDILKWSIVILENRYVSDLNKFQCVAHHITHMTNHNYNWVVGLIIVFHVVTSINDLEVIYINVHHNPNIPVTIFLMSNHNHASHWNSQSLNP